MARSHGKPTSFNCVCPPIFPDNKRAARVDGKCDPFVMSQGMHSKANRFKHMDVNVALEDDSIDAYRTPCGTPKLSSIQHTLQHLHHSSREKQYRMSYPKNMLVSFNLLTDHDQDHRIEHPPTQLTHVTVSLTPVY